MPIDLSIIFVNYKTQQLIIDCIYSIYKFNKLENCEIIIIDNSSDDPSSLIDKFPFVQWHSMGYNAGFARANNKGIQLAKGEVILLLNPDIIVKDDAIEQCYQRFVTSPYIACGVQLLNPDLSPQISGSYFMKGGLNHFLPLPFVGDLFKRLGSLVNIKKTSIKEAVGLMEVDWINGAFLMVKRPAMEKAGLMDEDFFLYAEEIEWCSRLRGQGKLCIYGDLNVIHLQGETANKTFDSEGKGYYNLFDRKGRQIMLSNFVRIRKQFGLGWFLIHLLIYLSTIPVFFVGLLLQQIFSSKKTYNFQQFKGFCKNLSYLLGKSLIIVRNKPYFYKAL